MAFGKGKESVGGQTNSFVKHIGIGMFEIAAINPDAKEYEQLMGRAPQQELVYVKDKDDHKQARICVYLRNVTGGATSNFITQANFFLENVIKKSRESGKIKVIDKYGNSRWIPQDNYDKKVVPLDTNGNKILLDQDFRACCGEEDLLVKMLRAYLVLDRPDNYVDNHFVFKGDSELKDLESRLEHVKDYFNGDFSELKSIVALQPNNKFQALLGIRTTDDGKEYQDVFKHHFLQHWESRTTQLERELERNKDFNYAHTKFEICPLKEYIQDAQPTNLVKQAEIAVATDNPDDDLPF